ncbi:MAG: sulfatase-like hydrolase/transferase, partial [Cyanobacteria bacterium P01_A01_bin.137]
MKSMQYIFLATEGIAQKASPPPNVLFISIDDLRPELGCYENPVVKSPHLYKLASQSHLFTNHFVTVPTHGDSRYGSLTGLHPRNQVVVSNDAIRKLIEEQPEEDRPETFVAELRRNGYYTIGIGKISHYLDGPLYGYT